MNDLRLAISAGELSGDEHASQLAQRILTLAPNTTIRGMGGRSLRAQGVETVVDSETGASVMGFVSVLASARTIYSSFAQMKSLLCGWRPDALVIVDYPDFNLRLARIARRLGIPVLYFIPPKVWAWRKSRVRTIDAVCTSIACIFPFERAFYETHGCQKAIYVGHPFHDLLTVPADPLRLKALRARLGLAVDDTTVLFFPGSRRSEISLLLDPMLTGFALAKRTNQNLRAVVGVAPSLDRAYIAELASLHPDVCIAQEDPLDLMRISDAGIIKSGTSNLQATFLDLPFSMVYATSRLSAYVARSILKISQFSPTNVVRPDTVREILQEALTPEAVAEEILTLTSNADARTTLLHRFAEIRQHLGSFDPSPCFTGAASAYERTARLVLEMVK